MAKNEVKEFNVYGNVYGVSLWRSGMGTIFEMLNNLEGNKENSEMKEFKENYPKIDTTIEKKELKEKLKEYQNNLEEEVLNIKEQQKYNEDMYFTGSFEELSREEKLEVLRIEREKLVSSEEKELEKQKVYQKSNDLKGFHEA